ncbi:MAG: LruC domain-containing protein, partial [Kangiellaceae bacterium]|nr:LruC domain-containing protein [Kangiellaceae bacterium]
MWVKKIYLNVVLCLQVIFVNSLFAAPFDECPSKAYLFQSNNVQVYGINLVTGSYNLLEDYVGLDGNINAVGFNFDDRYIYGFNTTTFQVVRVGGNFQAEALNVTGLPANTTFYVGDVINNYYYIYRKNVGFYRINVDSSRPNYLQAIEIAGADTSLTLTDFAIHPGDEELYAVDNRTGVLHRISLTDGSNIAIGASGETGTFGAGYFDVNGYYYISRNNDGKIFRIDITDTNNPDPTAVLFAQGPYSNQNDGARCANAPISVENVDWGDAPTSYATLLADNGPRHELSESLYMGFVPADGESDGLPFAVNDDNSNADDEDAIGFITPIESGLDALLEVTVVGDGYFNVWMDWNGDGDFADTGEQVFVDQALTSGTHRLTYRVPDDAIVGNSWARFRYSSAAGLVYYGGAPDGEVEDYPISVSQPDISYRYYPSENGWVALAYEDLWPLLGDFDMNDVVIHYRIVELVRDNKIIRSDIYGQLVAMGAAYHNGFAVHYEGVARSNVDNERIRVLFNNQLQALDVLESGQSEAVIKITDDLWNHVDTDCHFYRTDADCTEAIEFSFEVSVNFATPIELSSMPAAPYNPFIFGTPGWGRDAFFAESPGRSLEIHLADKPVTDLADLSLFGQGDDTSDPANSRYFKSSNN